ncbi:hypothetical protein T440DRAFT_512933 [Plenodomus tracheiphilus IPT5]|uniref:G-protein coupled receptors family 2 profile 2 domain-containing protein n=1 Tax=Plenodomus tracheiphilus IPT5 TaxID=1408161 RepID=A0A6A7BR28_9PLEO|nr:hypothetical protein T440DRAFT_512933 [Plenodomus tracheiphilus IPT5]
MFGQGAPQIHVDQGLQGSEKTSSLLKNDPLSPIGFPLSMASLTSSFSEGQYRAIEVVTRTTSVASILGSFFILGTFAAFPFFRKPINRLIFYATFGNVMVNVATLISTSALPRPGATSASRLCEFQGVLIQWFMSADAYWDFCMATNVLLVFFFGYNSHQLHKLEKWYFVFAYGVPGIPAITYVILDRTGRSVIGSATIWCWVNKENDWMRIAFFYAPVWLVISATLAIYIVTGMHIFRKRALLRDFTHAPAQRPDMEFSPVVADVPVNPFADLNNIVVTTEIGYAVDDELTALKPIPAEGDQASLTSFSSTRNFPGPSKPLCPAPAPAPPVHASAPPQDEEEKATETRKSPNQSSGNGKAGYKATAFASKTSGLPPILVGALNRRTRAHVVEGNEAAMAYLKVAMLMFVAMFMIWVPSTVNRLYSFVHKGHANFGLNLSSAVVLPLQGAWAATIYAYASRSEIRHAYADCMTKITGKKVLFETRRYAEPKDTMNSSRDTRESQGDIALEDVFKQREQVRQAEVAGRDSIAEVTYHGR